MNINHKTKTKSVNIITIETVREYLGFISDMRDEANEDEDERRFFFRGQSKSSWGVLPSVFRNGMLPKEAKMIKAAYSRNPDEFHKYDSSFEKLTKLQHYNLCTRLLDVTLNPLVALYFACQKSNTDTKNKDNKYTDEQEYGVVYCQREYGHNYNELSIRVLSAIAEIDFIEKYTIEDLLNNLKENNVINSKESDQLSKNDYNQLINIIQNNFFVISNFNNERIIKQNGAFLIAGCINILASKSGGKRVLRKAKRKLNSEFTYCWFKIPENKKDDILDELDLYNINEGSLFPEFEHQMNYIKTFYQNMNPMDSDEFHRFDRDDEEFEVNGDPLDDIRDGMKKSIVDAIIKWTPDGISKYKIYKIIEKYIADKWYEDNTVTGKIREEIHKCFEDSKKYDSADTIDKMTNFTWNMIISDVSEIYAKIEY